MVPHLYVSDDYGTTWKQLGKDLPYEPINVVKEDPKSDSILYVGTDGGLYVSFDAGNNFMLWNAGLPKSVPIHDIAIQSRDNEIVLGTHGRGFWILDNITPLRQISRKMMEEKAVFFKPQTAIRVRWNMWTDTPLPQEEPAGQNPPDGAIFMYILNIPF